MSSTKDNIRNNRLILDNVAIKATKITDDMQRQDNNIKKDDAKDGSLYSGLDDENSLY